MASDDWILKRTETWSDEDQRRSDVKTDLHWYPWGRQAVRLLPENATGSFWLLAMVSLGVQQWKTR